MKRFLSLWLILLTLSWLPVQASRTFNGTTQYASVASALVTAVPFSAACWVLPTGVGGTLFGVGNTGATTNDAYLQAVPGSGAQACSRATSTNCATSTPGTVTADVWNHVVGVWTSATNRVVYLNGGNAPSPETTNRALTGPTGTRFGARARSSSLEPLAGTLGPCAIWSGANAILSATEIASLAAGTHPRKIRPDALISCPHFYGTASPELDECGARSWTLVATPGVGTSGPPMTLFSRSLGR